MNLSSKDIYIHLKNSTFRMLPFDQGAEERLGAAKVSLSFQKTGLEHTVNTGLDDFIPTDKGPEKPALLLHTDC